MNACSRNSVLMNLCPCNQAKFYAPASRQSFIKQLSEANPVLDLPGDE
jgi:hypothetical protein